MLPKETHPGSFRDPSGFLFHHEGTLYRQIQASYKEHYDHFMRSGLYEDLVESGFLVRHKESDIAGDDSPDRYKTIRPEPIPFISYPYEWSFSQLKDAALTTLAIQKRALSFDMSLVDSSAYNVQFHKGRPLFIDTLSFRKYVEGLPWTAYRQFCQHFLAPLALMSHKEVRLNQLLRFYLDGVPLDLAAKLLPFKSRLHLTLLLHIHLHAKSQKRYEGRHVDLTKRSVNRRALLGLVDSLERAVRTLNWNPKGTEWAGYYQDTNYSSSGFEHKKRVVEEFLGTIRPKVAWDLGANVGTFSRISSGMGTLTIAFDIDPACVEQNYLQSVALEETNLLPLVSDLTNPSPGIGWENRERAALLERGPADAVMALALIHHLAIGNNLPFGKAAHFFARAGRHLVIEYVPKTDSQVRRLLVTKEDVFPGYTQEAFEKAFRDLFTIRRSVPVKDSERTLYWMERK